MDFLRVSGQGTRYFGGVKKSNVCTFRLQAAFLEGMDGVLFFSR